MYGIKNYLLFIFLTCNLSIFAQTTSNSSDTVFLVSEYPPYTILFQYQGKWGLLDAQHTVLIKNQYDFISDTTYWLGMDYHDYFVQAIKNGKKGFINQQLTFIPFDGYWAECFIDMDEKGLQPNINAHFGLRVMGNKKGKRGIMNQQGKWLVRPKYFYLDCPDKNGLGQLYLDEFMQLYDIFDWKQQKMISKKTAKTK